MSKPPKTRNRARSGRPAAGTTPRDAPAREGRTPLSEELAARASETRESLGTLFAKAGLQHFADRFRAGTNDDPGSDIPNDATTKPDAEEDVTAG